MLDRMMLASGVSGPSLYVEDVFSTYLYNGTGAAQTITNGIDLSGKGGLVWIKNRSGAASHSLTDTVRGAKNIVLSDSSTSATYGTFEGVSAFTSSGFSLAYNFAMNNASGSTYSSWTFRKAAKFFDVVTYTGTGSARTIAHNLGIAPGCIIVKRLDVVGFNWVVYHRSTTYTQFLRLNTTDNAVSNWGVWGAEPTSSNFTVGADAAVNANGGSYVAYVFAHDPSADGIIQCGTLTTDSTGKASVSLGWEPQWVLFKCTSATDGWGIVDNMRGATVSGQTDAVLYPNLSNAEGNADRVSPTSNGFDGYFLNSSNYIYIAIRRGPMRTPTDATKVFAPVLGSASGVHTATGGFPVDFAINANRTASANRFASDRLRGDVYSQPNTTAAETTYNYNFDLMNGYQWAGTSGNNSNWVHWLFRRAPGFFDQVCYTGTGVAGNVKHNLTVPPELLIIKHRGSVTTNWMIQCTAADAPTNVYFTFTDTMQRVTLNTWNLPTETTFGFGTGQPSDPAFNTGGYNYTAYLFASCPGVSKVGSYTGNGSSQTIDCGFSNGARFVLIKRTDAAGNWFVWDTVRGINAGNDPIMSLNLNLAESTVEDSVDPASVGFIVNQNTLRSINVSGATYIYLAIA